MLWVAGLPQPKATAAVAIGSGRVFYVDSVTGNDGANGRAASAGATLPIGPWKSLARLASSDLAAGDVVVLACGSVWNETLRLPNSGQLGKPIVVRQPHTGCAAPPTIDGSITVAAASWQRHSGSVYKTAFASPALQLHGAWPLWKEAHHPNLGHATAEPKNPYLPMAADADRTTINGREVSTHLVVGADLAVPAAASWKNARVRVRTNPYVIDESPITGFDGTRLTLGKATTHAVQRGWGYYLLGELWMLDSPGEWLHNSAQSTLYAWFADGLAPREAVQVTVLPLAVDLESRSHIVVDGLAVKRTGLGMQLRRSQNLIIQNSVIEDIAGYGIDADGSVNLALRSNLISRTAIDAVNGDGRVAAPSVNMELTHNTIVNSGVIVTDDVVLSLPRRSVGAVVAGANARLRWNTVINSAYIGFLVGAGSTVEDNFVFGTCSVQDDCGGIYTGGVNNRSVVQRNWVLRSRGYPWGHPERSTSAQGIYVDDLGAGVVIEANTVADTDTGVHLHNTSGTTVRANQMLGQRRHHLWLQEDSNLSRAQGDVYGNLIVSNQLATLAPRAVAQALTTRFASTAGFATFDHNRYLDSGLEGLLMFGSTAGTGLVSYRQWRQMGTWGTQQAPEPNGFATTTAGLSSYTVTGTNLVTNSALLTDTAGWSTWNATLPLGRLLRQACDPGMCLNYSAGGSAGILSSPHFAMRKGQWYRLSVDVATEQDNQLVPLTVRRGSGNYAHLSDRSLGFVGQRQWQRHTVVFQAKDTADPLMGATTGTARVDIDGVEAGKSVNLANLEVVPINADPQSFVSLMMSNPTPNTVQATCPLVGTRATQCSQLRQLANNLLALWPLTLPSGQSVMLYALNPNAPDKDGDGIADTVDKCPDTAIDAPVNARGCALGQIARP
jgi:Right handed beta helix region